MTNTKKELHIVSNVTNLKTNKLKNWLYAKKPTKKGSKLMHNHKSKNELKKITKRPLAYVASPYKGNIEENIKNARAYCAYVEAQGYIPIAPHLLFPQFISEEKRREEALYMALNLLNHCEYVFFFGDEFSEGMKMEYKRATKIKSKNKIIKVSDASIRLQRIVEKYLENFPEKQ